MSQTSKRPIGSRFLWLGHLMSVAVWLAAGPMVVAAPQSSQATDERRPTEADVAAAERLLGIEFDEEERQQLMNGVWQNLQHYRSLRGFDLPNSVVPALEFDPVPPGYALPTVERQARFATREVQRPATAEEIAFLEVSELAVLLRTRKITSVELTRIYLDRIARFGDALECIVTVTEELALEQAARADAEIAAGTYRGPLHGIPYGVKDLLAVKGYRTTWGAKPFENQVIDETATVVRKLEEAGAVLVAKLTLGALAWGDVWYGGTTRSPWDLELGSSGSSAGPASATAGGLVAFSIGSETLGSIVSPSTRCGVTGLRPTYGRVSRTGAMALSWSMDKLGPMCRSVEDCALVFDAIRGPDGEDGTLRDVPFAYDAQQSLETIRVGYTKSLFASSRSRYDRATLDVLRDDLGIELVEIELPDLNVGSMRIILSAEAAAAFDVLTRSGRDAMLVRQVEQAWPNVFRHSRFIPAVEYIQANRARTLAMQQMAALFDTIDVYVAPSFSSNLTLTNLTGHPALVMPNGPPRSGRAPSSITFTGDLFGEAELLTVARRVQEATEFHRLHPDVAETVARSREADSADENE